MSRNALMMINATAVMLVLIMNTMSSEAYRKVTKVFSIDKNAFAEQKLTSDQKTWPVQWDKIQWDRGSVGLKLGNKFLDKIARSDAKELFEGKMLWAERNRKGAPKKADKWGDFIVQMAMQSSKVYVDVDVDAAVLDGLSLRGFTEKLFAHEASTFLRYMQPETDEDESKHLLDGGQLDAAFQALVPFGSYKQWGDRGLMDAEEAREVKRGRINFQNFVSIADHARTKFLQHLWKSVAPSNGGLQGPHGWEVPPQYFERLVSHVVASYAALFPQRQDFVKCMVELLQSYLSYHAKNCNRDFFVEAFKPYFCKLA